MGVLNTPHSAGKEAEAWSSKVIVEYHRCAWIFLLVFEAHSLKHYARFGQLTDGL